MHRTTLLAAVLLFFPVSQARSQAPPSAPIRTVDRFMAAFNAHDVKAMAALVTNDVQWLSIADDKVTEETGSRDALVASMTSYFKSCPTCRSSLAGVIATANRVSAVEVAHWQGRDGPRTQRGVAVYEFSGELIRRVYYYPAEK